MAGRLGAMALERRTLGRLPSAATGTGDPVLVIGGLAPYTGPGGDRTAQGGLGPLQNLADRRRLVLVNRRAELPRGMTMAEMAAEHADAIRELGAPVDVVGTSTGGSIAQQLAADHPDVVRTSCSSAPRAGSGRGQVAAAPGRGRIRKGAYRKAMALMASALVPRGARLPAGVLASVAGPLVLRERQGLDDMATTIEAEDASTSRHARGRSRRRRSSSPAATTASTRPSCSRRRRGSSRAATCACSTARGTSERSATLVAATPWRAGSNARACQNARRRTAAGRRRGTPCARPGRPTAGGRPPGGSPRRDSRRARARSR